MSAESWPLMSKRAVAEKLTAKVVEEFNAKT